MWSSMKITLFYIWMNVVLTSKVFSQVRSWNNLQSLTSWSCFVCNRSLTGQQSSFFKIYQGRYGWTQPISQIVSYWVLLLPTVNQNRVKICNRYLCYQPANVSLKWSKYWKFYVKQVYNLPSFILISHEALKDTLHHYKSNIQLDRLMSGMFKNKMSCTLLKSSGSR